MANLSDHLNYLARVTADAAEDLSTEDLAEYVTELEETANNLALFVKGRRAAGQR
jgi:hypothetical protein